MTIDLQTGKRMAAGVGVSGLLLMGVLTACSSSSTESPGSSSTSPSASTSSETLAPTTKGSLDPQTKAPGVNGGQPGDLGPHG